MAELSVAVNTTEVPEMRIAVLINSTLTERIAEGNELRIYEIFRRMATRHEVHIFQPAPTWREWKLEGMNIHDVPPLPGALGERLYRKHFFITRYLHGFLGISRVNTIDADVLDVYSWYSPFIRRRGMVVASLSFYPVRWLKNRVSAGIFGRMEKFLTLYKIRNSDFLILISRQTEKVLKDMGLLMGKKYRYIPNGVDKGLFKPGDRAASRRRLGLPEDKSVVTFVGQMTTVKRPLDFITAFSLLPDDYIGLMAGRGPLLAEATALSEKLKIGNRLKILGYVDRELLPAIYSASDVVVYPTEYEIQPLVPQEAMSCGAIPVVSDIPGNNEIISDGQNGLLFRLGDVEELAAKIIKLCSEPALYEKLRFNGIRFMEERDWETTSMRTLEIYESLSKAKRDNAT